MVAVAGVAQPRHHRGPRSPHHGPRMGRIINPEAPEFLKKGDKVAILSPSSVPTDLSIIDKGAAHIELVPEAGIARRVVPGQKPQLTENSRCCTDCGDPFSFVFEPDKLLFKNTTFLEVICAFDPSGENEHIVIVKADLIKEFISLDNDSSGGSDSLALHYRYYINVDLCPAQDINRCDSLNFF